jgi:hypothetical protein
MLSSSANYRDFSGGVVKSFSDWFRLNLVVAAERLGDQ